MQQSPRWLIAAAVFLLPLPLGAQIATDRPDFVESGSVVPRGSLQLETSGALAWEDEASVFLTPTLLRWGALETLELRLETDFVQWNLPERDDVSSDAGLGDIDLGAKWAVSENAGWAPAGAFLVHFAIPTGSRVFRGDGVRPSLRYVAEWALSDGVGIGLMPGVTYDSNPETHFWAGIFGGVVGVQLTDDLRGFGEIAFERIVGDEYGGNIGTWDFGLAWLVNPSTQFDVAVALAATDGAPQSFVTVGFSKVWGSGW